MTAPHGNPSGDARRLRAADRGPPAGINLIGFVNHVLGLGESARQFAVALSAAGVPHAIAAIGKEGKEPRLPAPLAPWLEEAELPFDVTVLWCNPEHYWRIDFGALTGRWLVGRWAWELPKPPPEWRDAALDLHEIWTSSSFVATAVGAGVSAPVRQIPMAVQVPPVAPLERETWGIPSGRKLFLFIFDYVSCPARKNPIGLLDAFKSAFAGRDDAFLLIKTINAHAEPRAAAELEVAAAASPAVRVIDAILTPIERAALLAGCDCYVSLHRSEGFGMTLAEAMAYGRPVIGTDFGGSRDFLDETTGYPVRWRPVSVGTDSRHYPPDGIWAEPDRAHAAELMRQVVDAPHEAAARGRRAAERMASNHSPIEVGRVTMGELSRLRCLASDY
jgi:glycosyltransferase involved in cell wall biosynthesis